MPPGAIDILHEDDAVVAVSKPPGETVIPARGDPPETCLRRRLETQLGRRLWVVHRIDRDASGLVVFALSAGAHRALSLAFEHRQVEKTYVAFVAGPLEPGRGRIDVALRPALPCSSTRSTVGGSCPRTSTAPRARGWPSMRGSSICPLRGATAVSCSRPRSPQICSSFTTGSTPIGPVERDRRTRTDTHSQR
jgi:hypothetical protein